MKSNKSTYEMAPEFFLCWMDSAETSEECEQYVRHSREIVDDILKLPKEDVATWIGCLGLNFFLMYDMIRESDPQLAKMMKDVMKDAEGN